MTKATLFQHRSLRGAKRPSRCWAGNIARVEQNEGMLLVARARPGVSAVPTGWITSALENRHASFSTLRLELPQIPGINAYHGDVSVVCLIAGDVVAALEEERFRRIKREARVSTNAVRRCLGITRAKILSLNNVEHHPAHLASAFCVSACDEAAVRTLTRGRKRVRSAT